MTDEEVKTHLNIPLAVVTDDVELADFIGRTTGALHKRVGHVKLLAEPISEYRRGGRETVRVNAVPVGVVVEISVHGAVVPAADLDTGAPGWYLDDSDEGDLRAGIIRHTDRFPAGFVKVEFKPGRDPVPEDLTLAFLELLRHLWKTQRGTGGGRPGLMGDGGESEVGPRGGARPSGFSYPSRVNELIKPWALPVAG